MKMEKMEFLTQEEIEALSINDLESYAQLLQLINSELQKKAEIQQF